MSNILIDVPVCKSPRLRWLEKYNLQTIDTGLEGGECPESGHEYKRWIAGPRDVPPEPDTWSEGDTEDEAIAQWARERGIRLWNEEHL